MRACVNCLGEASSPENDQLPVTDSDLAFLSCFGDRTESANSDFFVQQEVASTDRSWENIQLASVDATASIPKRIETLTTGFPKNPPAFF